ncbi:MAG: hypothetical protein CV090_08340 [Nitrospira sp. WS238]|nr:hypothetical protein [Nitrospira sp. WS238]
MNIQDLTEKVVRLRIFYDRNLHTDSMRGNVIILSSVIHALLSDLIEDDQSIRREALNRLRGGKFAHSDFYRAIDSALLLGIVRESTARGLHLLRELRNDLAHGIALMGNDTEVSQRIQAISEALSAVPNDEPKWVLHGVAIKLIHGICYDYAESHGSSRDAMIAEWEPIRRRVLNEGA